MPLIVVNSAPSRRSRLRARAAAAQLERSLAQLAELRDRPVEAVGEQSDVGVDPGGVAASRAIHKAPISRRGQHDARAAERHSSGRTMPCCSAS